jgi:hypothetical protein
VDQDVKTDDLYDFLYRDSGRIGSLYAQIFGGVLRSFERTDATRQGGERTGRGSLYLFGGDVKSVKESQEASKNVFDPHDIVAADVINLLNSKQKLASNILSAPHGALVLAQGTVVFIDKNMIEMAAMAVGATVDLEKKKSRRDRNQGMIDGFEFVRGFLQSMALPSAFLLETDDHTQVVGTIKDSGMEEPISAYYFKHGTAGLSNVFVVGIKEAAATGVKIPNQLLIGAAQNAAQALSDMTFPRGAIRVTPIALFRKL